MHLICLKFSEGIHVLKLVHDVYAALFARKSLYKFNKLLYSLSLRGMGVMNFESNKISGESNFINEGLLNVHNGVFFDVGANIGDYSKSLRNAYPQAVIHSFEPHPLTFLRLKENMLNLNINILNVGVGAISNSLKLYDYADEDGSSHASLHKAVIEDIHKAKTTSHEVNIIALDTFVIDNAISRVDLLKIDTEGHELEVLKGFSNFIKNGNVDLIHFEFNEMNVASRVFFKDIWDFLPNYDFFRMVQDGLIPIKNYSPIFCEIFAYQNIVAKLKVNNTVEHND
jgi:FkbM family methyltransferase